jgi:hypothetical protein
MAGNREICGLGCKLPHLQEYHIQAFPDSQSAWLKGPIQGSRTLQKRPRKVRQHGLGSGAERA